MRIVIIIIITRRRARLAAAVLPPPSLPPPPSLSLMPLPPRPNLGGKVAIVTGASRGIGRECALALARAGCAVVVAAKSATPQATLPGTIYTVADEIKALGGDALPVVLDLRDENACIACVSKTIETYGRVDVLVNNASALWWHSITETPTKKYDLIQSINARGAFIMCVVGD